MGLFLSKEEWDDQDCELIKENLTWPSYVRTKMDKLDGMTPTELVKEAEEQKLDDEASSSILWGCFKRDRSFIEECLKLVNVQNLCTQAILAWLVVSLRFRESEVRRALFDAAKKHLESSETPYRVERLLSGL